MAITPGQEQNQPPKHVSSTSSIETMHNDTVTQSRNAMQPVLSHQSLDSTITQNTSPSGPLGISQNQQASFLSQSQAAAAPPSQTSQTHVQIQPSTGVIVESTMPTTTNTVPEFLYQLTKMLTDNNRDIIEWSNGKIEVHNPHKLQSNVLNRYFRHSKFASFQRQLNYFGFRKLAGKGKMAPCSYVNDATTKDLGSLLLIKRKVGNEPTTIKSTKKRDRNDAEAVQTPTATNPALTSIFYPSGSIKPAIVLAGSGSQSRVSAQPPNKSQQELARVAVGKGIRHRFSLGGSAKPAPLPTRPMNPPTTVPPQELPNDEASRTNFSAGVQEGLSALESNYKSSLGGHGGGSYLAQGSDNAGVHSPSASYFPGSLSHNDSLVDLAMIPLLEDSTEQSDSLPFTFIDFPWQDPNSSAS